MKTTGSVSVPRCDRKMLGMNLLGMNVLGMKLFGGLLLAFPTHASAATDADYQAVRDQLQEDWFYTEVVIFQRPAVMEFLSEEGLVTSAADGFPTALEAFVSAPGEQQQVYLLDPPDDGCQAFEFQEPRVAESAPDADDGEAIDASTEPVEEDTDMDAPDQLPVPVAAPRLSADPVLNFLARVTAFETQLAARNSALFPRDQLTLNEEATRIQGDRRYQVLWHGGWLQAVPARKAPAPMLLQTGQRTGERYQLEGFLDVTLGRYLHFHTRLFYQEPLLGAAPVQEPLSPTGTPAGPDGSSLAEDSDSDRSELLSSLYPTKPQHMVLEESRRVRSGELHYLDHPKLGVLVRIEPVAVPEDLVNAYLALQEDPE